MDRQLERPAGNDAAERFTRYLRDARQTIARAMKIFMRIDGTQRAGAFAHYAFFSFFPAIILFVTVASIFFERDAATADIFSFIDGYVPLNAGRKRLIFDTLSSVVKSRAPASIFATLLLCWAVMRFFATLIRATNRTWGLNVQNWWRLPLKSLLFLTGVVAAIPLVVAIPVLMKAALQWLSPDMDLSPWVYGIGSILLPMALLFLALTLFYKLAPRRTTRWSEVWAAGLTATVLMVAAEKAFGFYLRHFAALNAVYGTFGGIMALLMWIYLSGCIFIFGACLCAAGDDGASGTSAS